MLNRSKLMLAGLAAIMLLLLAVGNASAGRWSVSEQNFEEIWANPMRNMSFRDAAGDTVACPVTRLGSFLTRTIAKSNVIIGRIRHISIGSCTGGSITALMETLPWEIKYVSFTGTLPRITGISTSLIGEAFRVEARGTACLARTTALEPEIDIIENFNATSEPEEIRADESRSIPLEGGVLCRFASPATVSGAALYRNLPGNALIRVTLI